MLFNSVDFVLFFPTVFFLYFLLPKRFQVIVLLLASCYFYMSYVPKYILVLFVIILLDFTLARLMVRFEGRKRLYLLLTSIFANLGILFTFKYVNFFNENLENLARLFHLEYHPTILSFVLPLGLSFHIFQSLSYIIEVYKNRYKPETSLSVYALYVLFFPQLVAGPIERPAHLLPQLHKEHIFDPVLARKGLERMLWGFFKKLVIADQIAQIINPLYANLPENSGALIFIAILFTFQIYCDFSGYSDIALGAAQILGFELTENFNRPFAAKSVAEFWRRWHISLSNWVRDYLYYPLILGSGRVSKMKLYGSLILTFVVLGLWHGANWTFIIFGLLYGVVITLETVTANYRKKLWDAVGVTPFSQLHQFFKVITVFLFVSFTFIFFRSETVQKAWWFVTHLFKSWDTPFRYEVFTLHVGNIVFCSTLFSILILLTVEYFIEKKKTFFIFDSRSRRERYIWYYFIVSMIFFFGFFGNESFIYFQF